MRKIWIIITFFLLGNYAVSFAQYVEKRVLEGNVHFLSQEYHEALNAYSEVLVQNPKHAEAYLRRGLTFRAIGDSERYLLDFQQVAKLDPEMLFRYRTGRSYFPASLKEKGKE
ncbi:MAG: tetratricopeptide repeat protein [Bacteroidota bacterium]